MKTLKDWENRFREKLIVMTSETHDPAHDLAHFERVVACAKKLANEEGANLEVVVAAAWLHDFVYVPKNDPRRGQASRVSAEAARDYLKDLNYPVDLDAIAHAIEAHSFSAGIAPKTLEAKIVQDADRLDALGAIGVARCFATAALMKSSFYDAADPFAESRELDDRKYAVDHFYIKLFAIVGTLQTDAAKREGARRAEFMRRYLAQLETETLSPSFLG